VLGQLRLDFPDVTISKIRFLEAEGLIQPARTASGYRQFTPADVARLRFVLAAQRDHYLPLKVIKEQLDEADRGGAGENLTHPPRALTPVPADGLPGGLPHADEFADPPARRLTQEELLEQVGIDLAALRELEQYGLVRPGAGGFYDSESAAVARLARRMGEYGIEPRHLRAFRASADREVGLLEQIVAPLYRQHGENARGRADEALRELAALSVGLHTLLVKSGLHQISGR
jgi:DNA-binding transcriptional MerR regulator